MYSRTYAILLAILPDLKYLLEKLSYFYLRCLENAEKRDELGQNPGYNMYIEEVIKANYVRPVSGESNKEISVFFKEYDESH